MDSSVVTLNVGGAHFCTTRDTILREPSSRLALLVRGILPTSRDDAGHIFLDRDARYFQCILNYLRDGWALLPSSPAERRELVQEARHFQLNGMESWLRTQELLGDKSDAIPKGVEEPYSPVSRPASPGSPGVMAPTTPVKKNPLRASTARYSSPTRTLQNSPSQDLYSSSPMHTTDRYSPSRSITDLICRPVCPPPCCTPCYHPCSQPCIPAPIDDGFRWTSKYLRTNPKVREVVDTILELAYMPPHRALSIGRVYVSIVSCPEGETYLSNRYLVVKVTGALGWTFEFTIRPTCDYCLYQKYNMSEYVQDNWFVLSAILKDQYGIIMEEDYCQRHGSILSKRYNLHVTLTKPCC